MIDFDFEVEFLPNFYNKLNRREFQRAEEDFVEKITKELEYYCKIECPVDTGTLRDNHYTVLKGLESYVSNQTDYAPYVIYGTSRQAPNNYPSRAIDTVITTTYLRLLFEDFLRYHGIQLE